MICNKRKAFYPLFVILFFCGNIFPNNIQVSNVSTILQNTTEHTCYIQFDLSWQNSWRLTAEPSNWDAAWVFVKYKVEGGTWNHVWLSVNNANHSITNNNGTDMNLKVKSITENTSTFGTGCLIFRSAEGNGAVNLQQIRLKWNYGENGVADGANVSVKVFAMEMVYIPQGAFELGNTGDKDENHYHQGTNPLQPYYVTTNEDSIFIGNDSPTKLWALGGLTRTSKRGPSGFGAFYCMKYIGTQAQYVDFLNSLTREQQKNRVHSDISGISTPTKFVMTHTTAPDINYRSSIKCEPYFPNTTDPITFGCDLDDDGNYYESNDGEMLVSNRHSSEDIFAYADWAGMRLMTDLEFEKLCRGPLPPLPNEYVWGDTIFNQIDINGLTNLGTSDEKPIDDQVNYLQGISRAGAFARAGSTRHQAGASYYGVMDFNFTLSGSTPVSLDWYPDKSGDGQLSSQGNGNIEIPLLEINGRGKILSARYNYSGNHNLRIVISDF